MVLLVCGAAAGVALAAAGLIGAARHNGRSLPAGAVARVNDQVIRTEDLERAVAGLASDRRDGIDDAQRQQVLDRLIDEELLIQRGLELGLARQDRKVRADLAAAVIGSVIADREDRDPSDAELQTFYEQHRDFFTRPGRIHLRQIFFRVASYSDDGAVRERARQASERLRGGEDLAQLRQSLGDPELSPLPDGLLPAAKLVDYIGPTALQIAMAMAPGTVSEPVRSATGYHVFQVIERQADAAPPLPEIRSVVVAEFRRRSGEDALRAYLDELRGRADVAVAPKP